MYRVYFSRSERNDPLLLAKDAIDEAIFKREAAELGLPVESDPETQDENSVGWVVRIDEGPVLHSFLTGLAALDMPCLTVEVPEREIADWEQSEFNRDFSFEPNS